MEVSVIMRSLYTAAVSLVLIGMVNAQTPKRYPLPEPFHTESANNGPRVVPRPEGAALAAPEGFSVSVFAEGDFKRPRFMLLGPGNEIILSDASNDGRVWVIEDTDSDGKADRRKVIIDGLSRPYGLAFWKEYLYVAEPGSVKRFKYDAKTMQVTTEAEEVVSIAGLDQGHWTRTVLFSPEGDRMYLTIGSRSNVSPGEDPRRAALNVYSPDGKDHRIVASGLRNIIGLRYHPVTGDMWAAVQERDLLGDELVPDYFTRIREGGFYGWPYAYIGPNEDPRNKGMEPDLVAKTIDPEVYIPAHSAVLDFIFYTGDNFPKDYRGDAYLALHGSWNRTERRGYKIVRVPFENGQPAGGPEDFLTGWLISPQSRDVWGRPVGLLQMPDGSMLVSDDGGNKIWRVTYTGK